MKDIERRAFALDEVRVSRNQGEPVTLRGHAAVFNALSDDLGGFREQILPGAFKDAIDEDDVRALFNHNPDYILGRNKANTLRMSEDDKGLAIEIDLPDTQLARDLAISIERGDVSQMSFGFRVKPNGQDWAETNDGVIRTLKAVSLFDVSPVTYPAYPQTDIAARSLSEWRSLNMQQPDPHAAEIRRRRLRLIELGR